MMKNRYDADDIHQDVFVRFLKKQPRFDNEEHEKAWFIRVTVNCCTNYHKTAWRRKTVSLSEYERREESECAADDFTLTGIAYQDGALRVQMCMGDNTHADRNVQLF